MAAYRVRNGYVVHLPDSKCLEEGEVFEPSPEVLENQGWKVEPVPAAGPPVEPEKPQEEAPVEPEHKAPEAEEKAPKGPPKDRAVKSEGAKTK